MASVDMPSLDYGPDIGAALKAAREFRGLSLQDVSDATRIRRAYLAAIEDMRVDELPSRPFSIGYVKSYAQLLGFDPDAAVARFKDISPDPDEPLRPPVGVRREGDPRLGVVVAGGVVIIAAIGLWNFAQRAINEDVPPPPSAPQAAMLGPPPEGPVSLGAPLPAPVESTTPELYITPGLAAAAAAGGSADAADAAMDEKRALAAAAAPDPALAGPAVFTPQGTVYGAAERASPVTVQARKPASLIVRGADGAVYFARQLAEGEAYRVPALKGLTIDVSDPRAFDVYVAGQSRGPLPAPQTALSKLAG